MSSIVKHRQGHHISFKKGIRNENITVDDVSIRSSQDSLDHASEQIKNNKVREAPEAELDLPSDGASTFRDFEPREVRKLEKQIEQRDTAKQERIAFKTGDVGFEDKEIKDLLQLVPQAYEKMARMPYVYQDHHKGSGPTRTQIKKSVNKIEELMEQLSSVQQRMANL